MGTSVIELNPSKSAVEIRRSEIAKKIATAYFLEGKTQAQAVQIGFPHWSEASSKAQANRIFAEYAVVDTYLKTLPDTLDPADFERMLSHVKIKAFERGDERLMLEVIDRYGKVHGKLGGMNMLVGDVHINHIEKARKILESKGINVDDIIDKV